MTLRAAEITDASALAALSIEVWVHTYLREGVSSFFADFVLKTYTAQYFINILQDPSETLVVSQNKVGLDGFVRVSQNRPAPVPGCGSVEISSLYVQPRHHGRGIGHALLQAALDEAKRLQTPDLWLATNAENHPAIRFYLANGFDQAGETTFCIQGEAYPNVVFRNTLNA